MALTFALNGFIVYMVDLEGHGFTAGNKISGLKI
jgi:alpha-beta hydrolase superfamily lysophospholipase